MAVGEQFCRLTYSHIRIYLEHGTGGDNNGRLQRNRGASTARGHWCAGGWQGVRGGRGGAAIAYAAAGGFETLGSPAQGRCGDRGEARPASYVSTECGRTE